MKTTYLEYYKQVLAKVSFDPHLFRKEYEKALNTLEPPEKEELDNWLQERGLSSSNNLHARPVNNSWLNDFQYYRLWSSI